MLHGKLQNVAEQRALLYGLSAIGVTVLLSLHTFVTSTLSHVPSAMLGFLLNTLAVVLTVVFAAKKRTTMALHSAVFTAVLLLGSNATVLISTYNIGSEVGNLGLWMGIRSCGMLLLAAVTWVGISLLERWQEDGKRLPLLLLWAADIVSCLMAMFLSRGNTASVFGILIGLPMAILAILTMGIGFQEDGTRKIVSISLCALICLTLVVKHETGIPALLYAAFFVWYTLFYPRRNRHKKWIALLLAAVPAGGIGKCGYVESASLPVGILNDVGFEKSGISFLADLAGKFSIRAGMTYQIESGLKSLTKAGLFGSYRASHIPEWQTDMILVSDTHYLGWGFLFLMLLVTLLFVIFSSRELMNASSELHNYFRSMALCFVGVTMLYNLLAITGILPILGVQPFFTSSISLSYLGASGILLGFLTYDGDCMENLGTHFKFGRR